MGQAGRAQALTAANRIALAFALLACGLFVAAALDFRPANGKNLLGSAALKTLAGALALGVAVRASRQLPPLGVPLVVPLDRGGRFGWVAVLVGAFLLLVVAETNAHVVFVLSLPTWMQ